MVATHERHYLFDLATLENGIKRITVQIKTQVTTDDIYIKRFNIIAVVRRIK